MTPIQAEQMAKHILTSLTIIRLEDGLCSYPTEIAQFSYERALFEVSKWITRCQQDTIEACVKVARDAIVEEYPSAESLERVLDALAALKAGG